MKFNVKDKVFSYTFQKWGEIVHISENSVLPIQVKFDDFIEEFTQEGCIFKTSKTKDLFYDEITQEDLEDINNQYTHQHSTMTPNEIAYWYSVGNLGSFSTALFELFMKADEENKQKLRLSFPEYYEAYQLWFYKPKGWDNISKEEK